jgi:hypothetical protein
MWKSAVSISTVGGKGGKNSFIVFPALPMDRHFHACFGGQRTQLSAILCDDWRQTRSGWLAKQNQIEPPFT